MSRGACGAGRRPSVSVVVCTYTERRWNDLMAAVNSVVAQLHDGDECLVIVDHNAALLRRAEAGLRHHDAVRVLPAERAPGLSGARNTGVTHGTGEIVAFLDDDAVAMAGWLDESLAVLTEPRVAAVGGAAVPHWTAGGRPGWFPPEYDWVVGCSYRGLPRHRAAVRNVIGAAMAFRRDVFDDAGLFDGAIGRVGAAPLGCEETALCIRLHQVRPDARIVYLPSAVVRHRVPRDRSTVRYFLHRCYAEGVSKARIGRLVGRTDALASERAYVRRTLPRAAGRELARAARGRPEAFGAASMIVAGVAAAGLGFVGEHVRHPMPSPSAMPQRRRAEPWPSS